MTTNSGLFDKYIAVDWSARNVPSPKKPSSDALWIGELDVLSGEKKETYWSTRFECVAYLKSVLKSGLTEGLRTIVGYDLDFGFPAGFVDAVVLSGAGPKWKMMWDFLSAHIEDNEINFNNRFQVASKLNTLCMSENSTNVGPLWGCPVNAAFPNVSPKSPTYPFITKSGHSLRKKRWTEVAEKMAQPVWKLIGSASVGGQTLTGIPAISKLRFDPDLDAASLIWPFETGFNFIEKKLGDPFILHVEIWPGILSSKLDKTLLIKDQAQVRATVEWLSACDKDTSLRNLLGVPSGLSLQAQKDCIEEEGWVIGSNLTAL